MGLPPVEEQLERLRSLGLPLPTTPPLQVDRRDDALLVIHPAAMPVSDLVPHLSIGGRQAFVVEDLDDLDAFLPIESVQLPDAPVYLVHGVDRGDAFSNWTPIDALVALESADRSPLTVSEGICWLLQQPDALQRNHCFMTIGSRKPKPDGTLDTRVPAIWFSNGTGRDGRNRKDAPKVGWCWAGNRHTWLGFASARERTPPKSTSSS